MNDRRYERRDTSRLVLIMGSLVLGFLHSSALGGLYECTDGSGSRIFTDRPAQLQRCTPLPTNHSSGNQTTPNQVSPTAGSIPYQNALPAAIDPPPAPFTASPDNPTSTPNVMQSCMPGLNPLNPLAAPPCHQVAPGQAGGVPRLQ
jgi:hypothetical protein